MADSMISWAVALDGGTTNTRARLIDVGAGRIVATARRAVGVRDAVLSGKDGNRPLDVAVRAVLDELARKAGGVKAELIVAAGMLSSEVGLTTVPHVVVPAGLDELAGSVVVRRLPAIADQEIVFIPGVRTPAAPGLDGWAVADLMRGEECETLGAWLHLSRHTSGPDGGGPPSAAPTVFLWPGSHTKLVAVDLEGRIVRSHTTLAGEMLQAIARHTLLAASLPEALPDDPDLPSMMTGARLAEREGLGRAAFLVRVAALTESFGPRERAAFWVGAVVADDVAHLARHPILQNTPIARVGGRHPLRDLYVKLLAQRIASPVVPLDDELADHASALGALAVALRHCRTPG